MRGLIIGKFNPPHRGHYHLIETALGQVDHLDLILVTWQGEDIPVRQREAWLKADYPVLTTHILNQDTFDKNQAVLWGSESLRLIGREPDVIFSSETYGELYAELLHCRHVMVDRERLTIPITATAIRAHPDQYRDFVSPAVFAYLTQMVQ